MAFLSEQEIDWLALEGNEIIGFKSGSVVPYDLAGYDRSVRLQVPPGSLPQKDALVVTKKEFPDEAETIDDPYLVRLSGFRREKIYGPDEIGKDFQRRGIALSDGLGNGLYENLLIDRKYGLQHCLEAPTLGFRLPFFDEEWKEFRAYFPKRVQQLKSDLQDMEAVYRGDLANQGERFLVLWCRQYPLALFVDASERDSDGMQQALLKEIGRGKPPVDPQTSEDRLALVKFWNWIRKKQADIVAFQAKVLREELGNGLKIIANPHELPRLDMTSQGKVYEFPAVAIRPLLLDDDVFLKHYISHFTRLFFDLTEKPPMVSVRMNLSAATPRFVPTGNLIATWYDQAVRYGANSFYFWTRDYPTADTSDCYDGPIPGNTDPVALAMDRWETSLDVLGALSTSQKFTPPDPEVAIYVPYESALLQRKEWREIYAAFSACSEAGVYTRFISDNQIEDNGVPAGVRMIFGPVVEFVSPALRAGFEAFTANNGSLYVKDRPVYDQHGKPAHPIVGAKNLPSDTFKFFPLGKPALLKSLKKASKFVDQEIKSQGIKSFSWVFDVTHDNLPKSTKNFLREPDPEVEFTQWLYEHGSDWIHPYLKYSE